MIRKIKTSKALLFLSAFTVLERAVEKAWRRKFDKKQRDLEFCEG